MNYENFIGHLLVFLSPKLRKAQISKTALIIKPLKIDNPKAISIGARTYIGHSSWLMGGENGITLDIENDVQIGHFAHIIAVKGVHIEQSVLIADKVFISDCTHNYMDINLPVVDQGISVIKKISIGQGSWIGEGVCVCGATIGKHCVIGANAVVTKDIPDYSVAVGSPAKVIKQFNHVLNKWVDVKY